MAGFFWFIQEPNKQKSGTENLHNMCFLDLIYDKMMNLWMIYD